MNNTITTDPWAGAFWLLIFSLLLFGSIAVAGWIMKRSDRKSEQKSCEEWMLSITRNNETILAQLKLPKDVIEPSPLQITTLQYDDHSRN